MQYAIYYILLHILIGIITSVWIGCEEYVYIDSDSKKYVDGNFIIFGVPAILIFSPLVFITYSIDRLILKFGKVIQADYSKEG